jgi:hypothetical protein
MLWVFSSQQTSFLSDLGVHLGESGDLRGSACAASFTDERIQALFKEANIAFQQPEAKLGKT